MDSLPYYKPINISGNIYTIDKLKIMMILKQDIAYLLSDEITNLYEIIPGIKISEADIRQYRYKYTCTRSYKNYNGIDGTMTLKLIKNRVGNECDCYLECNPNKLFLNDQFVSDLMNILSLSDCYWIDKMDIAIDIPIPKPLVSLKKDNRIKLDCYKSKEYATEYLGKDRNAIGHIKLYDKTQESKLLYPVTRFEITVGNPLDIGWKNDVQKRLPLVTMRSDKDDYTIPDDIHLNETETVLVELLMQNEEKIKYWNRLGYRQRKKLEPLIFQNETKLEYDLDVMQKAAMNIVNILLFSQADIIKDKIVIGRHM